MAARVPAGVALVSPATMTTCLTPGNVYVTRNEMYYNTSPTRGSKMVKVPEKVSRNMGGERRTPTSSSTNTAGRVRKSEWQHRPPLHTSGNPKGHADKRQKMDNEGGFTDRSALQPLHQHSPPQGEEWRYVKGKGKG